MQNTKLINKIPFISVKQMIEVDRMMIEEFGITLVQMMENAGRNLAELTIEIIGNKIARPKVLIMAGSGGNGGGAIVAARHLSNKGLDISLVLSKPISHLEGVAKHQAEIIKKLPINIFQEKLPDNNNYDIIIDGIIGYSLNGNPKGFSKSMIEFCNNTGIEIISLDTPSGLNLEGDITNNIIKANYTMTLALPKIGLIDNNAKEYTGKLILADISVPPILYENLRIEVPCNIFNDKYLIYL